MDVNIQGVISKIEYFDELAITKGFLDKYSTLTTEVYCTLQFEAIHNWKNCPLEEVKYLKNPHRHIFWIKAYKQVSHLDRDLEFIILKHNIQNYLIEKYPTNDFGSQSCEMIATELLNEFNLSKCDVSEDNENGAMVTHRL